jgi:hypothetical protein
MSASTTAVTTPNPTPTPLQVHHTWLDILTRILQISAVVAPAAAAPFVTPQTEGIIAQESQIVSGVLGQVATQQQPQ